jgi:hypothetical protein
MSETKLHTNIKQEANLQFCTFKSMCLLITNGNPEDSQINGDKHSQNLLLLPPFSQDSVATFVL